MPIEFDDLGLRLIGVGTKGIRFYDDNLALQAEIYLQADGTLNIVAESGGGGGAGGGGPTDAMYLVLSMHDDLTNARVLVAGDGLRQLDSGARNNYTLSVDPGTGLALSGGKVVVDQSASLTWTAAQAIQGTLTARHITPEATDTYDLGTSSRLWRKGYLSELEAFIFAENTISLVGGWVIVPHDSGTLAADVAAADVTIDFGKAMTPTDWVQMRSFGQVEYLLVGALSGGTTYNVTRNVDGSGANDWPAGMAFFVMGQAGDGRIELNSAGPNLSVIIQGATYNATTEPVKIDSDGVTIAAGELSFNSISWSDGSVDIMRLYAYETADVWTGARLVSDDDGTQLAIDMRINASNEGYVSIYMPSIPVIGDMLGVKLSNVPGVPREMLDVAGNIAVDGNLKSMKNATAYDVYGWKYLTAPLTSTNFDGDSFSTTAKTLIDLSAVFGVPAGVKGVLMYVECRDEASAGSGCWISLAPNDTAGVGIVSSPYGRPNDITERNTVTVPCDANGDIYYQIQASGASTFDVWLRVWGYAI